MSNNSVSNYKTQHKTNNGYNKRALIFALNGYNIEKDAYTFYDEKWDCAEMVLRK